MTEAEANEIIEDMHKTALFDTVNLHQRIAELKADYATDPHETTAAQITRLEARLKKRAREATALAIALLKF